MFENGLSVAHRRDGRLVTTVVDSTRLMGGAFRAIPWGELETAPTMT
jgi:hypothetical protein